MAGREGGTVDGAALSFPEDPIDKKPAMLQAFRQGLIGLSVSNVWRGHGSALFIEFGTLKPTTRLDGTVGEGSGEFGLMIEWSEFLHDRGG